MFWGQIEGRLLPMLEGVVDLTLEQLNEATLVQPATPPTPVQRVRQTLAELQQPAPLHHLRKLCGMRTTAVCAALAELSTNGEVVRDARGYQLKLPFPVEGCAKQDRGFLERGATARGRAPDQAWNVGPSPGAGSVRAASGQGFADSTSSIRLAASHRSNGLCRRRVPCSVRIALRSDSSR